MTFVIALFDMIIFDLFDSADISRTVLNLITALFDFRTLLCFWKVLLLIYMYNDYKSTFSDSLNPKKIAVYACRVRYCYSKSVRLTMSICLSVTLWYCIEMNAHIVRLFPPAGRDMTLVF